MNFKLARNKDGIRLTHVEVAFFGREGVTADIILGYNYVRYTVSIILLISTTVSTPIRAITIVTYFIQVLIHQSNNKK